MTQHHGDRQQRVHDAGAKDRDDDDRQQQAGQRQQNVHEPQDRDLDAAAEQAGDETEHGTGHHRERHHRNPDQERQAGAVDQARKHVASDGIGAEQVGERPAVLPEWRPEKRGVVVEHRRVRRDDIGESGQQHDGGNHRDAGDGAMIGAKRGPELLHGVRRRVGRRRA